MSSTTDTLIPSSLSSVMSVTTGTTDSQPAPTSTRGPGGGGGNGNGGPGGVQGNNNSGGGNGGGVTTNASLYLYTFLATLVLLLSVSGAIVFRSFVLRRRHRMMVEEAIRNGTWVPAMGGLYGEPGVPPGARGRGVVDLSKKPVLWEAWLGGGGRGLGGDRKEKDTSVNGAADVDIDWDMIKPFSVAYLSAPSRSSVNGSSTPLPTNGSRTALPHETSAASTDASGSTAVATPPLSNPSGSGGQIISSSTPAPLPASSSSIPQTQTQTPARPQPRRRRSRAFLGWLSNAIDPNGAPTSPLPEREREHDGTHREGEGDARLEMDEMHAKGGGAQDGPKMVRVAVMIAMPRAPTVVSGLGSGSGSTPGGSVRNSSIPSGMGSHPLQDASTLDPGGSGSGGGSGSKEEEEEERLPHLEMGIADVLLIPSDFGEGKDGDVDVDGKRRSGWTETEGGHG